jgi:hypothetical protein
MENSNSRHIPSATSDITLQQRLRLPLSDETKRK